MPKTSALIGVDPTTAEPTKPKMVLYGPPGVGKTWFTISFPCVYYISPEPGATRDHYKERLKASGGRYVGPEHGAGDFDVVVSQAKALAVEKHPYKTLVIDSITKVFNEGVTKESERLGDKDVFGAAKKPAIANMRRLVAAVQRLDLNVIFVAHETAEWGVDGTGQRQEIGKKADVWDKLIYELDLAFHCQKRGASRVAVTRKSRLLGFPEGEAFALDYAAFAERYGKDIIERESSILALCTPEQVGQITDLVARLKVDAETQQKWLDKANAETFAEFTVEQATKVITSLKNKLPK